MPELKIVMLPTDELVPYAGNAKIHTDDQVEHREATLATE